MNRPYPRMKTPDELLKMVETQLNQTDSAIRKTLRQQIIEKYLDPDSGLLDKMLGCGLLTWDEFDDMKTPGSQRSKNEKLLNLILQKDLYKRFLNLLNETQHSHLVDYESDSDYYRRIVRGDIPLTKREEAILDMNREVMVEVFKDLAQVAEQLHLQGVLNETQKNRICSTLPSTQKGEMLVNMMRRRSVKDFKAAIHCFRAMRQSHLANILEGGVTGRVTCRLESVTKPVDEDAIVRGFSKELSDCEYQMDGIESNFGLLRLGLTYVRRSNGIVLYFHFRSPEELQALRNEFKSGSLRQKAEEDFNDLMTLSRDKVKLTIEWPDHDYQRCALYFTLFPSTTVNDLPLEILDIILKKSIQFLSVQANDSTDLNKFFSLASISYCWSQRLRKSIFQKAVHRDSTAEVQKVRKRSAILRNNREYLMNEIQPNELIYHLVQSGCLTEKQASSLRRFQNRIDKNSELLRMARAFSFVKHLAFTECLYLTNQMNAARIVDRGGGTVKLCIKNQSTSYISALEKHLVGKLQKILRECSDDDDDDDNDETDNFYCNSAVTQHMPLQGRLNKSRDEKLWPHKLFNTLSIYDIVILGAQQGRGVIELWLLCQSQDSFERLRNTDEGELIKITEQLFSRVQSSTLRKKQLAYSRFQSSTSLKPQTAFIDSSYFEYDVVVRRMSAKLRGTLPFPRGQRSTGWFRVCSLQGKIYVIYDRTMIHISEDKAPYRLLESRNLLRPSRVLNPLELAACPVHKCLYIADLAERCVWKMNPADDHQLKKWLLEPVSRLSVLSDGKVLELDNDFTSPKLKIYTPEAILESTVPLRGDPHRYSWAAVELMPGVVAVQYQKYGRKGLLKGIAIMRLNATGDVLCEVKTKGISCLAPYSPGRLIAGDQESKQVIVLDSQLKPLQLLLSLDTRNLEWPHLLYYRKDTREFIANHFGFLYNQFHVYKLSYDDECE